MISNAAEFAQQTWGEVRLGDERLRRRAIEIGASMAANPEASLPGQMKSPAALEGAYRFMNNKKIRLADLLGPVFQATCQAAGLRAVVLFVNDQTELDYTFHNSKKGLGPIGNDKGKGLLMHSTLAIDPEQAEILGLAHLQVYLRQSSPKPRPKWTRTPEGQCWETSAEAIGRPPAGSIWVEVSDAGSDYFNYMAVCLDQQKHFLVRVSRNRWLDPGDEAEEANKLIDYVRSLPPQAGSEIQVQVSARKNQAARVAQVVMAWSKVTIPPSAQAPQEERQHDPLQVWVLRIWEPQPPTGVDALEWILLSSLPVTGLEEAHTRRTWYTWRWCDEDFHQCLKTGCQIERSQLDERADLERLIGFAAPIATRLLQLRQAARQTSEKLAAQVVDPLMVEVLAKRQNVERQTMSIQTFWRLVAQLGGFQGRKGDGDPGWRTLWRGWRYLSDLTDGARLFSDSRT